MPGVMLPPLLPPPSFGAIMKPHRDTRARNLVFFVAVISALVVGFWLAK
ncbi:hypothetical protein HAL1_18756 [Halomonas sp. HAL1]|nr:hypothetical protein HAL1_18756 [Halomonas sp. HAL1]